MNLTPLVKDGSQIIQSYASGRFRVSGEIYNSAIIVTPVCTTRWNSFENDFCEEDFAPLIEKADEIDVVLLGCGAKMRFLPPGLKNNLKNKGLSVEIMDTGAACRTYNVLMPEGRRVVAALLPV